MSFFRQADIQSMLARTGGHDVKLASIGSGTTKALINIVDEALLQDPSLSLGGSTKVATIETGSLAGLDVGSEFIDITDNVHYRVQQFMQIRDGAITKVYLADL
jgi:hypothetical protein